MRSFTPQVETSEISDTDLDNVSGGLTISGAAASPSAAFPAVSLSTAPVRFLGPSRSVCPFRGSPVAPPSDGGICCEASQPGASLNLREHQKSRCGWPGTRDSSFQGPRMPLAVGCHLALLV